MDLVQEVIENRIKYHRMDRPDMTFEEDLMETECGTRGLIRIINSQGEVIGLEFIEPEGFWADPDAVEEYAETLEDGIIITVIVPDDEGLGAEALLREEVGKDIMVIKYSDIGRSVRLH